MTSQRYGQVVYIGIGFFGGNPQILGGEFDENISFGN